MKINSTGLMYCVRAEAKAMLKQEPRKINSRSGERDIGRGAILNVGSANSYAGLPGKLAYVTSKHAVMGITKMAGEQSPHGSGIDCTSS
jgi:NAD(P)-dependent dehydrogenase (short-subunit alcohol dehydrogenase family)